MEQAKFADLTYKPTLVLSSYKVERNKSQAQRAISYEFNENLSMGRHILPYTQQLIDMGFIARTNPDEPRVRGHKHLITDQGQLALDRYLERFNKIATPNPAYGY